MFAKVYTQIFDSSIAEDYQVRHVFEDLLKLCNVDGIVDMTIEAVARRTNVPFEIVSRAISELLKPDSQSRTKDHEGRRLLPIDPERCWGWIVVNYDFYRGLQDEEARRKTWRESKRKQRGGQEQNGEGVALKRKRKKSATTLDYAAAERSQVRQFEAGTRTQEELGG